MSGEDNNTINTPMMEQLITMLNSRFNSIEENNNNMNININNNINSLKADMNNINEKVGSLQAESIATREDNLATREELLVCQDCPQELHQERPVPNSSRNNFMRSFPRTSCH